MRFTIGSLFDGSGTAPLAATILGGTPLWASEIEPYPVAVTKARFPNMLHLGDITRINGAEVAPVDIIVGGSPCQDLSVAGKQAGLESGTRSNLFYQMTRIIREMRGATNGEYPRFVVWENVPGAFSSNKGGDFHAVVAEFCAIADSTVSIHEPEHDKTGRLVWRNAGAVVGDGWSFAWRVLDAQYWGVPQRRRRIYAVLDLGSERAGEILFERASLPRNHESCGAEGEGTPADAVGRADRGGGAGITHPEVWHTMTALNARCVESAQQPNCVAYPTDVIGALCARADSSPCIDRGQPFVAMFRGGQGEKVRSIGYSEDAAPTLRTTLAGGNATPQTVYALQGNGIDRALTAGCNGAGWREGEMYTLNTVDRPAVVYDARGNGNGEVAATITGDHESRITDYTNLVTYGVDARNGCLNEELLPTLQAKEGGGQSLNYMPPILYTQEHIGQYSDAGRASTQLARQYKSPTDLIVSRVRRYIVRRLIPLECGRLQGFQDWWCDGVPGSDSAQYRMWGNGMALPCVLAVMNGIKGVMV